MKKTLMTEKVVITAVRETILGGYVNYYGNLTLEEQVDNLLPKLRDELGIPAGKPVEINTIIGLESPFRDAHPDEPKEWNDIRRLTVDAFNAGVALGLLLAPKTGRPAPMNQEAAIRDVREELLAVLAASGKPHLTESARGWLKLLPKATAKHRMNDVWMGRILGRISEELPDLVRSGGTRKMLWRIRTAANPTPNHAQP